MWGVVSFAFASGIKIVPVFFLPALLFYFRTWRQRLGTIAILAAFWVLTANPWLLESQASMIRVILGYHSVSGSWGINLLLRKAPAFAPLYDAAGVYILMFVLVLLAWRLNRGHGPVLLFYQFGILLFVWHLLTPGFGIQYLAWLTPWAAALPLNVAGAYFAASGAFCATLYTDFNGGPPWYYASFSRSLGHRAVLFSLMTWFTVGLSVAAYCRLVRSTQSPVPTSSSPATLRASLQ
jgi:hypothetical protein